MLADTGDVARHRHLVGDSDAGRDEWQAALLVVGCWPYAKQLDFFLVEQLRPERLAGLVGSVKAGDACLLACTPNEQCFHASGLTEKLLPVCGSYWPNRAGTLQNFPPDHPKML